MRVLDSLLGRLVAGRRARPHLQRCICLGLGIATRLGLLVQGGSALVQDLLDRQGGLALSNQAGQVGHGQEVGIANHQKKTMSWG